MAVRTLVIVKANDIIQYLFFRWVQTINVFKEFFGSFEVAFYGYSS